MRDQVLHLYITAGRIIVL